MTQSKKRYLIVRGIENDKERHEAGEVVALNARKWPVKHWLETGVLKEVKHGDR